MSSRTTYAFQPVPRRIRRTLILVAYLGYLGVVLAWSLLDPPGRWLLVLPLGLAAVVGTGMLLMPQVLGVSDGTEAMLDERQLALRNRTYLNAYRVLGALVVLGALYVMLAHGSGWWLPRTNLALQAVFWGVWLLAVTLPTAILAWSEPDADSPDE